MISIPHCFLPIISIVTARPLANKQEPLFHCVWGGGCGGVGNRAGVLKPGASELFSKWTVQGSDVWKGCQPKGFMLRGLTGSKSQLGYLLNILEK